VELGLSQAVGICGMKGGVVWHWLGRQRGVERQIPGIDEAVGDEPD